MKFLRGKNPASGRVGLNIVESRGQRALMFAGILLPVAFLWGCAGVVSGQSNQPTTPPNTYSISGTITATAGGSGATVTLSGAANASTIASSSGNYTVSRLTNGAYTVTPSNAGFAFTPVNRDVTINGVDITGVNFTANAEQTHSATLSWAASTSTVSGYNVYRGTVTGGPYTLLNTSLITVLALTDTGVQSGQTYFYVTTSVDGGGTESVYSNEISAIIP